MRFIVLIACLQSLQAETPHVPETLEYGISSFVYRARKPFDPEKIYDFMNTYFCLQEPDWRDAIADNHQSLRTGKGPNESIEAALESLQTAHDLIQDMKSSRTADEEKIASSAMSFLSAALSATESAGKFVQMLKFDNKQPEDNEVAKGEKPRSAKEMTSHLELLKSKFGNILRSKGFIWLASRPNLCGEWSQAGGILRFTVGGPWYASLPDEAWPSGREQRQDILKDFQDPFGDRRQELVMIGIDMKKDKLIQALDSCLINDYKMDDHSNIALKDPFATWPALEDILDAGDDDDDDDDSVEEENVPDNVENNNINYRDSLAPSTTSRGQENNFHSSGPVYYIREGASEAQAILDEMEQGKKAIFHWHANWHSESEYAFHRVSDSAQGKEVALIHVDIAGNHPNWSFAMEKVMTRPEARRPGAKPVLKHGAKWPCFTVHTAPQLQPFEIFTGSMAVKDIVSVIATCPDAKSKVSPPKEEAPVPINRHQTVYIPENRGNGTTILETIVELSGVDLDQGEEQVDIPTITNGALQLKEILREANSMDQELFIIWYEKSLNGTILKYLRKSCKTKCKTIRVMTADIIGSSGNKSLAGAFKVAETPTILIFAKMKLQRKVEGFDKVLGLIQNEFNLCQTTKLISSNASTTTSFSSTSTLGGEELYDPPKNQGGSKATKLTRDGKIIHFFPKMPCLRCGCPWWSSEGWDGRCVRCGWSCEKGGYDDDSKPLPQHKDQWSKFVISIRNGVTPAWNGKKL